MAMVDGDAASGSGAEERAAEERILEAAKKHDLIFVGSVLSVGPAPQHWSGRFPAYQEVRYRVEEVVKGTPPGAEITVRHVVVKGGATAVAGDQPGLSPDLFKKGARLLVMAQKTLDGLWASTDERSGAVAESAELVKKVRGVVPRPN